jgi:hypothetical protein
MMSRGGPTSDCRTHARVGVRERPHQRETEEQLPRPVSGTTMQNGAVEIGPVSLPAARGRRLGLELQRLLAARRGYRTRIEGVSDPADPDRDLYPTGDHLTCRPRHRR